MKSQGKPKLAAQPAQKRTRPILLWGVLALVLLATALLRIRMIDIPLERDEGEYAYAGQLMLHGVPPYELAYTVKPPGTPAMYALSMAMFGETVRGVRIGFMLVNAATIILMCFLGKRWFEARAGVAAAASYAALSTTLGVFGQAGHATQFVMLPAVGGLLLLLSALERRSQRQLFLCGVLFGLATLMKQAGAFFGLFAAVALVASLRPPQVKTWRHTLGLLAVLAAGGLTPILITMAMVWFAGCFDEFWFWTVTYAREYGSVQTLSGALEELDDTLIKILSRTWPLMSAALIGAGFMMFHAPRRRPLLWIVGLALFSALGASLGLYFRAHYFILLWPAVALLAGASAARHAGAVAERAKRAALRRAVMPAILVFAVVYPTWYDRAIVFAASPAAAARAIYSVNPFPESEAIARYIRSHSDPDARLAVIGSEPQIYFLAQRISATGYIYTYSLMEPQPYALRMQEQMIAEIEWAKPQFAVVVNVPTSWLRRESSPNRLFKWVTAYFSDRYRTVGIVEIKSGQTIERWDEDVAGYAVTSPYSLRLLERLPER